MPANCALTFDHVSKRFRRGHGHDSLRDLIPALIRKCLGTAPIGNLGAFWAVNDVSFDIPRGQCCGLIGANGAGKSTILKLLSGIMRPNHGRVIVSGRVSSLIEVGAGFHPDLTGRDNVYLNGTILGMKRRDIDRRFDRIVEFAGLSEFIDTPIKRYSSGMQARLGFSVAAHMDPDILLVDEVLSVGDMTFQNRCLERMEHFRRSGKTVVLVSHNLRSIAQACERVIVLERGRIVADTDPTEAINVYIRSMAQGDPQHGGAPKRADIFDAKLTTDEGDPVSWLTPGDPLRLSFTCRFLEDVHNATFGFYVTRIVDRLYVYGANASELGIAPFSARAGEIRRVAFDFRCHLTRGLYHANVHAKDLSDQSYLDQAPACALLDVREQTSYDGIADLEVSVHCDSDLNGTTAVRERVCA